MNTKKKIVPLNTTNDGLALALVSGYYKFGAKNLLDWKGTTGTCIMEIEDIEVLYKGHILHDGDGLYIGTTDAFFRGGG